MGIFKRIILLFFILSLNVRGVYAKDDAEGDNKTKSTESSEGKSSDDENGDGKGEDEKTKESKPRTAIDWRKDVKCQKDIVGMFRKTNDPRILYVLHSRTGMFYPDHSVYTMRADEFKNDYGKFDEWIKENNINMDVEEYLSKQEADWKEKYGENAVVFDGKYYKYLTTKKDEKLVKILKKFLSKVRRKYYEKRFDTKEKIEGRFLVKMYPDREEYIRAGSPPMSGAYFSQSERALVGFVNEDWRRENINWMVLRMMKKMFHEGWHQYVHYYAPGIPTWIDEGFAEMHEAIAIQGNNVKSLRNFHIDDARTCARAAHDNGLVDCKRIVYMSQPEFYSNATLCYAQGWAMTHFMVYGSSKYKKYYKTLMEHLQNGESTKDALDMTFADMNWERFNKDLKKYILSLKIPTKSERPPKFD